MEVLHAKNQRVRRSGCGDTEGRGEEEGYPKYIHLVFKSLAGGFHVIS